ncbi:MAG: MFS transporter [Solirubrobacteraceae bacterium]
MSAGQPKQRLVLVLAAMTLANAMILVDQTAVPLALPNIMKEFHVGSQDSQWVLNASLLPLAGLLVLGGRLGDLFGRRRVFVLGTVLFAGASALGGLAPAVPLLLAARVVQGVGGALMLPTTVAIVGATYPPERRGWALGTMGGAAAVAGALGPTIGGVLTSAFSWRAVLLVNVPLAIAAVLLALRHVAADRARTERQHPDISGTVLLCIVLVGLVFGLSQSQQWGWSTPVVLGPLALSALAVVGFVIRERRATLPLMDFKLLRHRNYLGASVSQLLAGMAEMGLGVIFPLLLIINLGMSPALAGLALIPTTVPMVLVAPLAGRWYDRAGGRAPLVVGFIVLAISGGLLAWGVYEHTFLGVLPGLLVYGIGLSLVLTTNDPVSLDTIPDADAGQASGVSATAEQFGGALGIAALYSVFHAVYVQQLHEGVNSGRLPDLSDASYRALKAGIEAAETTGLRVEAFSVKLQAYLGIARDASEQAYLVTFLAVAGIAIIGSALVAWLVRKPARKAQDPPVAEVQPGGVSG